MAPATTVEETATSSSGVDCGGADGSGAAATVASAEEESSEGEVVDRMDDALFPVETEEDSDDDDCCGTPEGDALWRNGCALLLRRRVEMNCCARMSS
jgi:hypothetical protein